MTNTTDEQKPLTGYGELNTLWGCDTRTMRKPTDREALKAARLLLAEGYRAFGDGKKPTKYTFNLTSGRRQTYPRGRVFYVNPDERGEGFAEIVHSVSHFIHYRCQPGQRSHDFHVAIERYLVKFVIKRRWIEDGLKLRDLKPRVRVPIRDARKAKIESRLKTWQAKQKRANNAVKKLQKQLKRYN